MKSLKAIVNIIGEIPKNKEPNALLVYVYKNSGGCLELYAKPVRRLEDGSFMRNSIKPEFAYTGNPITTLTNKALFNAFDELFTQLEAHFQTFGAKLEVTEKTIIMER